MPESWQVLLKVKEKEKKSSSLVMEDTDDGEEVTPSRTHAQPVAIYVILGLILLGVLIYFLVSRKNNKKENYEVFSIGEPYNSSGVCTALVNSIPKNTVFT